ncbi:antitoxin HicB [Duganella sp. 1411]|uniref:type II toxin-antitoxin system HicB family antitoxin n=1 Tax=Duganella sp. 1411 TaxID=2806572 RepID=UPI001AE77E7B|nr:type II toxin-antitoxin system HicB family antitoxin [Duganella sp. 1411]MBP1207664.1 antitoxin HicB [Duganella sp. 1411]
MKYPSTFTPETGGFVVTFRDIPEAITQGDTEQEALDMARDALITAMDFYFEDRRPVPAPSKAKPGERMISLPINLSAKVLLLNEMLSQKVIPAELARRMGVKPQEVTRILDLGHSTKIDTVAAALSALGRELCLSLA